MLVLPALFRHWRFARRLGGDRRKDHRNDWRKDQYNDR